MMSGRRIGVGRNEVVYHGTGYAYAFDGDGKAKQGWPVQTNSVSITTPVTIADLNQDGRRETVSVYRVKATATTYNLILNVFDHTGKVVKGWPLVLHTGSLLGYSTVQNSPPVVGDVDSDRMLEIFVYEQPDGEIYLLNHDGTIVTPGWPVKTIPGNSMASAPSVANLDQDGKDEVVISDGRDLYICNDGQPRTGPPCKTYRNSWYWDTSPIMISDIDKDNDFELLKTISEYKNNQWVYSIVATHHNGQKVDGFPITEGGSLDLPGSYTYPRIVDTNNDGTIELVVMGRDRLYTWTLPNSNYDARTTPWVRLHANNRRIGSSV